MKLVKEREHAITYGLTLTEDEILAGKFVLGLKRGVDLEEVRNLPPQCESYKQMVLEPSHKLIEAGFLEVKDGRIQFTRIGRLFENEICAAFYTPRVRYLAHERRGTITEDLRREFEEYKSV